MSSARAAVVLCAVLLCALAADAVRHFAPHRRTVQPARTAPMNPVRTAHRAAATGDQYSPLFRNAFRAWAARLAPQLSDEEVANLVMPPPPDLYAAFANVTSLADADALVVPLKYSTLAAQSQRVPFASADIDTVFRTQTHPNTLVLIPGYLGELLHHLLFEDTYNASSVLSRRYAAALSECGACADGVDESLDIASLGARNVSMSELAKVWSVDGSDGQPLVQFIHLQYPLLSLESFSLNYSDDADLLFRRLGKLMRLLSGAVFDLYPVGYSRSAGELVEMLADERLSSLPVRGAVLLAGVMWGSPLADCMKGRLPSRPSYCETNRVLFAEMERLSRELRPSLDALLSNNYLAASALANIAWAEVTAAKIPEMAAQSQKYPDVHRLWTQLVKELLSDLQLQQSVTDYPMLVRRAVTILTHVVTSMGTLTTDSCAQWHREHVLPATVPLFVLTNTQPDANETISDEADESLELHPDTYLLREEYYQVRQASGGLEVDDGQLTLAHALPLPSLHRALNPQQPDYSQQVHWLAVLGATHWSSAFPVGLDTADGWWAPYPRAAQVMALATVLAAHAQQ